MRGDCESDFKWDDFALLISDLRGLVLNQPLPIWEISYGSHNRYRIGYGNAITYPRG